MKNENFNHAALFGQTEKITFGSNDRKQHAKSKFIKEVQKYYFSETIKLSLVTGPFYAFTGQFQYLSQSFNNLSRPFRFNCFVTSFQLAQHMFKQGILGLYKGNLCRLMFFISTVHIKKHIELEYDFVVDKIRNKILKDILLFSLVDIIFNPLLFLETRLMLQNKKPFCLNHNIFNMISSNYKELYKGSVVSLYRNFFFCSGITIFFLNPSTLFNWISIFISHLLSYPFLTIQRNIMARSNSNVYLEQDFKAKNKIDKFFRFSEIVFYFKNFGIIKIYRGFPTYIFSIFLWHYYVPPAAKFKYYQNIL